MSELILKGRYQDVRTAMDRAIINIARGAVSGMTVIADVSSRMNMALKTNCIRMRKGASTR